MTFTVADAPELNRPVDSVWLVGVDTGGTFTDLVAVNTYSGELRTAKVPSTPDDPSMAFLEAIEQAELGERTWRVVHGTTLATNAVLQRRGASICLVTTMGFEDVAYIQRRNRRYAFDLHWQKPEPLVRRRHCIGVRERLDARGNVVVALSKTECERAGSEVRRLCREDKIEAVAICLLFGYLNDTHERLLAEVIQSYVPEVPVSLSSVVAPIWREYERTSTVLADAYVKPMMTTYIGHLQKRLVAGQRTSPLVVLKSNGGTASPISVALRPVATLLSGLAGGLVGAAYFAAKLDDRSCITFDMGGTSTDVGLLCAGVIGHSTDYEIEWGLPVATPVVDVRTVAAGGGSIATVDAGGLLRVGPRSAGARPGPACYGLGSSEPTVTDANLVLGRLDPGMFLGGRLKLDGSLAELAVERVGARLGIEVEAAAEAIVRIANENMANVIRIITIDKGIDTRDFTLLAWGGAGPLHACGVAEALGIRRVVVPPYPGLGSAFGAMIAPPRLDRVWSIGRRVDELDEADMKTRIAGAIGEMGREAHRDGARRQAQRVSIARMSIFSPEL